MENFQTNITDSNDDFKVKINASNQRIVEGEQMVAEIASTISSSVQNIASLQTATVVADEQAMLRLLLAQVESFAQRRLAIETRYIALINEAKQLGNEQLIAQLEANRDRVLDQLNTQLRQQSGSWLNLFNNLNTLTAAQIDQLVATVEAGLNELELNPEQLRSITNEINRAKAAANELRSVWTRLFGEDTATIAQNLTNIFNSLGESTASLISFFGGDNAVAQQARHIQGIATGAVEAGAGIARLASGDIVGGITSLATGIGRVATNLTNMRNARHQRAIEELTRCIRDLSRAYAQLGHEMERAFSTDRAAILEQKSENLREQNAKIERQMEAERSKKNTNQNALQEFERQIAANNRQIERHEEAARNAIAGTTVMNAINSFATAYVNAWRQGGDAAKATADVARNIMINALKQAMKTDLQYYADRIHRKIAEAIYNDSEITAATRDGVNTIVGNMNKTSERWQNAFSTLFGDTEEEIEQVRQGVTGELQKAMTEGTASQLVGLWNMTAMDIRDIRNCVINGDYSGSSGTFSPAEVYTMTQYMREISFNTYSTAYNTERISEIADDISGIRAEMVKKSTGMNTYTYATRG